MSDYPTKSFLKYGGLFVLGVGAVGIVVAIVDRGSIWNILWGCTRSAAFLYIGGDMYRRSNPSK
jgi:hypothetical protein